MSKNNPEPVGAFTSTPIHASKLAEAREILSRTYKPERWRLVPLKKFDFKRIHFGARYAWTFRVQPIQRAEVQQ